MGDLKKFSDEQMERIVKLLGGTLPDEQPSFYRLDFTYNGFALYMKRERNKFEVHVCMPNHNSKAYNTTAREKWDACTTSINVGSDKDDVRIVADIKRRFDWTALDLAKTSYAEADQHYIELMKQHHALCDTIAAKIGSPGYRKSEQTMEFHGPVGSYGDITVNLLSIDFIIRGVDSRECGSLIDDLCSALSLHKKPAKH